MSALLHTWCVVAEFDGGDGADGGGGGLAFDGVGADADGEVPGGESAFAVGVDGGLLIGGDAERDGFAFVGFEADALEADEGFAGEGCGGVSGGVCVGIVGAHAGVGNIAIDVALHDFVAGHTAGVFDGDACADEAFLVGDNRGQF